MRVVYRPVAINATRMSADYIENELKNPQTAMHFKEKILYAVSLLKDNPEMGNLLSNKYEDIHANYRYIIVNKQFVFYELEDDRIEIIRVLDSRTDYLVHLF